MVNSFCEHWCSYQWWTSPPSALESWVIETFMKWAKAARHSECIFKLVSLRGFSVHFYSLDFFTENAPKRRLQWPLLYFCELLALGARSCSYPSCSSWLYLGLIQWPYTVTKSWGTRAYPQFNRKSLVSAVTLLVNFLAELRKCFSSEDPGGLAFDLDLRAPLVLCKTWQHPCGENIPPCIFLTHLSVGAICLSNLPRANGWLCLRVWPSKLESSSDGANDAMTAGAWWALCGLATAASLLSFHHSNLQYNF